MAKRDNARAARILADAEIRGDEKVAENWKISAKTIQNYREALEHDTELSATFQKIMQELHNRSWADELNETMKVTLEQMREHAQELPRKSAESLKALTLMMSTLGELAIAKEMYLEGDADDHESDSAPRAQAVARQETQSPAAHA